MVLSKAEEGSSNYSNQSRPKYWSEFSKGGGWRGEHTTDCGKESNSYDYLLENGMITNSLAVFYLKWYRNSISENDWKKLKELEKFYQNKSDKPDVRKTRKRNSEDYK